MAVCFTPKVTSMLTRRLFTVQRCVLYQSCHRNEHAAGLTLDTSKQEQLQLCAGAAARMAASGLKLESGGRSAIHTLAHILNPIGANVGVHYALSILKGDHYKGGGQNKTIGPFLGENFIKMWRKGVSRCTTAWT